MQLGGLKFNVVVSIVAVLALIFGVWATFFQTKGFVKSTATIVSIEDIPGAGEDEDDQIVIVEYDVDGKHYSGELDTSSGTYKVGKEVTIYYDPADPSVIHGSRAIGIYAIVVGVLMLIFVAYTSLRSRSQVAALKETHPESMIFGPSIAGEERELYFLTDRGTAKFGHRLEDGQGQVLYEAKVTKFHALTPIEFAFIDHVRNNTTPHLISQEQTSENNTIIIDNHSTIFFDGQDIWKFLKDQGIEVESSFMERGFPWVQYRVFRDGNEIALIESSSFNVHEDEAAKKGVLGDMVPARGFYRVFTKEVNLDLLFLVILAFARTSANDAKGGNYGLLLGKKRKR